jgi:lipoprotein-releasing system permease protein
MTKDGKSIVVLLSRRFLTGKSKSGFLSFISMISLFGVGLGVAALVTVMAVMEGFETKLHSLITGTHSHIILYSAKNIIREPEQLEKRLMDEFPDIVAVAPYVFSEVMIAHRGKIVGSLIEGIDREGAERTTKVIERISRGKFPEQSRAIAPSEEGKLPTIVLGSVVAEELGVEIGTEVSVVSPYFDQGTLEPRARRFLVSGILSTGMYEYDSKYSLIDVKEAVDFFQLPTKSASALRIKTKDPALSARMVPKVKAFLGFPYNVRDWSELNQNLLYAIKLQKAVIFIVLTAIILVAAFNIMSTLVILMDEKKREMAILKAMGLTPRDASRVFLSMGIILGGSGALAGSILGLILCQILSTTQFVRLPPDIYFISYLPVDVRLSTLLFILLCALGVAVLATLYPSWRARMESPIEGLRYE